MISDRKKKAQLVLPILVLPFIVLLFWAGGGGKVKDTPVYSQSSGFNFSLPSAQLDDRQTLDKLSMYELAKKDSLLKEDSKRFDPFAKWMPRDTLYQEAEGKYRRPTPAEESPFSATMPRHTTSHPMQSALYTDPNEEKVQQRLHSLEKMLADSPLDTTRKVPLETGLTTTDDTGLDNLQTLAQNLKAPTATQVDPELTQMDAMLSKILDIQHPDRVKDRAKEASEINKGNVYSVERRTKEGFTELLRKVPLTIPDSVLTSTNGVVVSEPVRHKRLNAFFGIQDATTAPDISNAIPAVAHLTQVLVTGATLRLRLMQDIYIQGQLIPAGTFVYGECSLAGERLNCTIRQVHYKDAVFPVSLLVYDQTDGMPGIRVPGAITRDVAKQGTDEAIQSLQLATLDPSIGAQAASAGIETVKNFLSKKTKLIKVTVKADHPVLLVDNNANR